jgi:transcriptional regulator with XRE-family HTH domain
MPGAPGRSEAPLPNRIRSILASRGLSLAEVSRSSWSLASSNRLLHIPHNFYSAFHNRLFTPSIYQVLALSILSGYRLVDWLALFGFSLDDVPFFQASLPALRTVELDSTVYQTGSSIRWFDDLKEPDLSAPLVPLSRWLASASPRRFDSLSHVTSPAYRYLKIGSRDTLAFPELLPGSIVRVKPLPNTFKRIPVGNVPTESLFLVEHSGGMTCSRLCRPEPQKVVLCSRHLPYAQVEFEHGTEAVVSGVADLEIRSLGHLEKPVVPTELGRFWIPAPLTRPSQVRIVGEFIGRARKLSGLSFREASARTKLIARKLGDSRYYCAAGSLSDYETRELPPRHIHKLISICAVYFASPGSFLEASGAGLDKGGKLPMPAEFLSLPVKEVRSASQPSHFLGEMERRFGQLPYFLRDSVSSLFGLPEISVRDVFWVGGTREFVHPYLRGATFLVVDRKQKNPRPSLSFPKWAQPVFVLQQRDGSHLCGFCSLQNGSLILRSCLAGMPKLLRLRNQVEAEVVGKVVGIVRQLA